MPGQDDTRGRDTSAAQPGTSMPGPVEAGQNEAGLDDAGLDEAGLDEAGLDEAGSDDWSRAGRSAVPEARAPYDDHDLTDAAPRGEWADGAEERADAPGDWADVAEDTEDGTTARSESALPHRDDHRSLGQLVASASHDVSELLRGEIALAKTELKESAVAAGKGAGMFGAAAFLAYVAFLMLSIAAGYGLVAAGLHPAFAFLIVAGVYLLVAGIVGYVGMRSVRKAGPPARTKQSIEEAKALVGRGNGDHHG